MGKFWGPLGAAAVAGGEGPSLDLRTGLRRTTGVVVHLMRMQRVSSVHSHPPPPPAGGDSAWDLLDSELAAARTTLPRAWRCRMAEYSFSLYGRSGISNRPGRRKRRRRTPGSSLSSREAAPRGGRSAVSRAYLAAVACRELLGLSRVPRHYEQSRCGRRTTRETLEARSSCPDSIVCNLTLRHGGFAGRYYQRQAGSDGPRERRQHDLYSRHR